MLQQRKRKWMRMKVEGKLESRNLHICRPPTLQIPDPNSKCSFLFSNLKTELTFLTMKMKICASCYLLWLWLRLCSFFGQTKKYVGPIPECVFVCVCVCGFVKSASVISVRLNGAKQTWAKNSDRKRPQRGPKKNLQAEPVLCRQRERERERQRVQWERGK